MSVKKRERGRLREQGRARERERGSAESDQYSNCKMNLTRARTSHQMGKEIGYERWPAIKSDIPQCHLSDSGWGIMTTANESWALVRWRFKSAPCRGRRLAVLTQWPVLHLARPSAAGQKGGKPLLHPGVSLQGPGSWIGLFVTLSRTWRRSGLTSGYIPRCRI